MAWSQALLASFIRLKTWLALDEAVGSSPGFQLDIFMYVCHCNFEVLRLSVMTTSVPQFHYIKMQLLLPWPLSQSHKTGHTLPLMINALTLMLDTILMLAYKEVVLLAYCKQCYPSSLLPNLTSPPLVQCYHVLPLCSISCLPLITVYCIREWQTSESVTDLLVYSIPPPSWMGYLAGSQI